MTWSEFKQKVEALGVKDDTLVAVVDIDAIDRREEDAHDFKVLVTSYPGAAIVDDRAERHTLPGPGEHLKL